jgi:hypothetical protein
MSGLCLENTSDESDYNISYKDVMEFKVPMERFAQITEEDIRKVWGGSDMKLADLVYKWDLPLGDKMIFRFRGQAQKSPFCLCKQIDGGNQGRLLRYFGFKIYGFLGKRLIEFMAWIKNGLAGYSIDEIFSSERISCDETDVLPQDPLSIVLDYVSIDYVSIWHNNNEIQFFFLLDVSDRCKLIQYYTSHILKVYASTV